MTKLIHYSHITILFAFLLLFSGCFADKKQVNSVDNLNRIDYNDNPTFPQNDIVESSDGRIIVSALNENSGHSPGNAHGVESPSIYESYEPDTIGVSETNSIEIDETKYYVVLPPADSVPVLDTILRQGTEIIWDDNDHAHFFINEKIFLISISDSSIFAEGDPYTNYVMVPPGKTNGIIKSIGNEIYVDRQTMRGILFLLFERQSD